MIFCTKCFNDSEIEGVIRGLSKKGKCETCGYEDSFLYDTGINTTLTDYFDSLISIYTPIDLLPENYPKSDLKLLKEELINTWDIFNGLSGAQAYDLITNICKDKYKELPQLFDGLIGIEEYQDKNYLEANSILRTNRWEDFVSDLKTKNRFHTNHINTKILEIFCSYRRKSYKKGEIFYRGRISSETYGVNEMGAPPSDKAAAGRANSFGISCLYLASDMETTIHEIRAGAFDCISIGKFVLQNDIIVVDLKSIDKISPFWTDLDCTQYAINKEVLRKINKEMAKPLRRNDSPLEYIPTQYISEFIKSIEHNGIMEYSGIEYDSTVSQDGYNLAIFTPELFECVSVDTYKIEALNYRKKRI